VNNLLANVTPVYLLYLFYGASFLFLGVSIAAKDMKGSDLKLAGSLRLLGAFGFLHGFREWLELGSLIEAKNLSYQQIFAAKAVAVVLTVLSFLFLLQFGISLVQGLDEKRIRWSKAIPAPLFLIWIIYVWHGIRKHDGFQVGMESLRQADIGARLTFGFVGGGLTAYGLIAYSREVRFLSGSVAKKLFYTGISFVFFAIFTGLFHSGSYLAPLPVPPELLRGISAFLIAFFITNALNIFDIETRKKIEQQTRRLVQVEKLASLGQLAAGIAHEINNPLANASLGIQTLKKKFGPDAAAGQDVVRKLDAVERNIDRASAIAQELLQFSSQRESEFIPLNINSVIQGALALMRYKLSTIAILQELAPVPDILGDSGKLQQVFINILSNATEAMPDGGTISLSSCVRGDMVIAKISDTGVGIEAENLSRAFDPFFTTKEVGSGTGLGLYICYGIIRQHCGTFEIDSKVGKGTVLTIKLPNRERYEKDTDRR